MHWPPCMAPISRSWLRQFKICRAKFFKKGSRFHFSTEKCTICARTLSFGRVCAQFPLLERGIRAHAPKKRGVRTILWWWEQTYGHIGAHMRTMAPIFDRKLRSHHVIWRYFFFNFQRPIFLEPLGLPPNAHANTTCGVWMTVYAPATLETGWLEVIEKKKYLDWRK